MKPLTIVLFIAAFGALALVAFLRPPPAVPSLASVERFRCDRVHFDVPEEAKDKVIVTCWNPERVPIPTAQLSQY